MTPNYLFRQQGATLIEVLITVVILAVGLLGLAALQITSVQSNQSAYYRSQATLLAYDLADRMRANRTAALNSAYSANFPASSSKNTATGTQASIDEAQWLNELSRQLPDGTGLVKLESDKKLVTISVRWNDNRGRIKDVDDLVEETLETFTYRTEI